MKFKEIDNFINSNDFDIITICKLKLEMQLTILSKHLNQISKT